MRGMTEQAPAEREHWTIWLLSAAGYLLEFASILVQVYLVAAAINISGGTPGEGRGFAKMGLSIAVSASFFLVIPATLIAFGRIGAALGRFRAGSGLLPMAIHTLATLLPFISYPLVFR